MVRLFKEDSCAEEEQNFIFCSLPTFFFALTVSIFVLNRDLKKITPLPFLFASLFPI